MNALALLQKKVTPDKKEKENASFVRIQNNMRLTVQTKKRKNQRDPTTIKQIKEDLTTKKKIKEDLTTKKEIKEDLTTIRKTQQSPKGTKQ